MATGVAKLRNVVGALALLAVTAASHSAVAQQPKSVDPTTSAVKEEQLLQQFETTQGRGSIPDTKSYTIEQPAGRDWRHFHGVTLRVIGGLAILGMLAVLVIFYLSRGMVRIESGRSGRTIVRFNGSRTVRASDGDLVRHSHIVRAQHHLRQTVASAADAPRSLHRLVGMDEVRAQLPELSVHPRRHSDFPDADRRQYPQPRRSRMAEARRRYGRP
jgi:hypothetical protein